MRYESDHKQKTRERVLKAAGQAIRAEGPHRVGVAEVMAKAGLTHGGFYAHFRSKDDLVAAAIDQMFADSRLALTRAEAAGSPAAALSAYIDSYLSPRHRDARTGGCPVPFLSADIPRLPEAARVRFAAGVASLTEAVTELLAQAGHANPGEGASSLLAELVGALSLARAEPDQARSGAILDSSRRALKHRFGLDSGLETNA
jgi:TetR/AcrR family transcriptional repressor of nem operon